MPTTKVVSSSVKISSRPHWKILRSSGEWCLRSFFFFFWSSGCLTANQVGWHSIRMKKCLPPIMGNIVNTFIEAAHKCLKGLPCFLMAWSQHCGSSQRVYSIVIALKQLDTYRQSVLLNELCRCGRPLLYEHLAHSFNVWCGLPSQNIRKLLMCTCKISHYSYCIQFS